MGTASVYLPCHIVNTPRYYFGHGLSYTTFTYSDLLISDKEIDAQRSVRIEASVCNTGEYEGDEVVQLYLIDRYASMTRPVKELAGFKSILFTGILGEEGASALSDILTGNINLSGKLALPTA